MNTTASKLLAIISAFILILSLSACNSAENLETVFMHGSDMPKQVIAPDPIESITPMPPDKTTNEPAANEQIESAEEPEMPDNPASDFEYSFDGETGGIAISSYIGDASIVRIPNEINGVSVTVIDENAFEFCYYLTEVIIPDSVTIIGKSAFVGCEELVGVTIPAGVTTLGDYVFSGCSSLQSIEVDADNLNYASVDGVLFNKDISLLLHYPAGRSGAYVIPDGVLYIETAAFSSCNLLTDVTMPDSLEFISVFAFNMCYSLERVTIPDNVTLIGYGSFAFCSSLRTAALPAGLTTISRGLFTNCSSLESVIIPDGVTEISFDAFTGCSSLDDATRARILQINANAEF